MSRSDEEGFHPHPGDPWHPKWSPEEDEESQDPIAPPRPSRPEDEDEEAPERRGLFRRRKRRDEPPDEARPDAEPDSWEDEDWGDELAEGAVAADLETVSPDFPSWTDEGEASVEFESAFTVGGDPGVEEPALPGEEGGEPSIDAQVAEPPPPVFEDDAPTELVEAAGEAAPGEDLGRLDLFGEDDDLPTAEQPIQEIPEGSGDDDLMRAVAEAAAAVGASEEDLVEIADEEVPEAGGLESGDLEPGDLEPGPVGGHQADPGPPPGPEPGSIPEPPPDPDEGFAPVEEVDAALAALAAEPTAATDRDVVDALRAIDEEEEDLDDWEAFAEGATPPPAPPEPPRPVEVTEAADFLGDAGAPLAPSLEGDLDDVFGEDELPDEPREEPRRGWMGRRKRKQAGSDVLPEEPGPASWGADPAPWEEAPAPEVGDAAAEVGDAAAEEQDDWDDEAIADAAAVDEFFGAEEPRRRRLFGRRDRVEEQPGEVWDAGDAPEPGAPIGESPEPGSHGEVPAPEALPDDGFEGALYAGAEAEAGYREAGEYPSHEEPEPDTPADRESGHQEPRRVSDEQPLSGLPLVDGADDRIEVIPLEGDEPPPVSPRSGEPAAGTEAPDDGGNAHPTLPPPPPPPTGDPGPPLAPPAALDEDDEPAGEWEGDGSRIPSTWFADVDEDEVEIPDMLPVDAEEPAPLLEAGEMIDVGDILDPVEEPAEDTGSAPAAPQPPAGPVEHARLHSVPPSEPADDDLGAGPPLAPPAPPELAEPPNLFGPPPGGGRPVAPAGDGPDLLGTASSLFPQSEDQPEDDVQPWDDEAVAEPVEGVAPGDEPSDPDAAAEQWIDGAGEEDGWVEPPGPPQPPPGDDETAVYDVVEDDLDSPPPAPGRDDEIDWDQGVFSGAVTTEHRGLAEAIARAGTEEMELQALSAAMPGLESGVVGFEDVEDLGTDEVYIPPARSDLGARILTGLLLVSLLFASLWAGGAALAGFISVMTLIGLTEFYTTLRHKGYTPLALFGILGTVGALAGAWFWGPIAIPGAILATTAVTFFFYAFAPRRRDVLVNGGLTILGTAWLGGTVGLAMPIIGSEDYRVLVFALVAATVAMDVGAYGFGKAWGSAQMAPVLSPNKSIEGLAGGVVLSLGAAMAVGFLMDPFDIRTGAALGLVVAVAAPLGDLAESMFKRSLGVKDMGSILPGHGGIMDRIDAFLFVIPPVWVLYELMGYLV